MDNELLAQVSHVTVNFSYMGFSVDPDTQLSGGGACGSCSMSNDGGGGGGCGPKQ